MYLLYLSPYLDTETLAKSRGKLVKYAKDAILYFFHCFITRKTWIIGKFMRKTGEIS